VAADGSFTISHFTNGLLKSSTRKDANSSQISQATYSYDAHGCSMTIILHFSDN
jgi:hypothetical protein